jgi:hypothetical protein
MFSGEPHRRQVKSMSVPQHGPQMLRPSSLMPTSTRVTPQRVHDPGLLRRLL